MSWSLFPIVMVVGMAGYDALLSESMTTYRLFLICAEQFLVALNEFFFWLFDFIVSISSLMLIDFFSQISKSLPTTS